MFSELYQYQKATEQQREQAGIRATDYYDLSWFQHDVLNVEVEMFILNRAHEKPLYILNRERAAVDIIGWFCIECEPHMDNLVDYKNGRIINRFNQWFNSLRLKKAIHRYGSNKENTLTFEQIEDYFRALIRYSKEHDFRAEIEKQRWDLRKLEMPYRANVTERSFSINFTNIVQLRMRYEMKKAVLLWMRHLCPSTIKCRIAAVAKLSNYLLEQYSWVESIRQLNREMVEDYLIYRKVECVPTKGFPSELKSLKAALDECALIFESDNLKGLMLDTDVPSTPKYRFQTYSENEQKLWIEAIQHMEEQVGCALLLHMILGTRISEIQSLRQDCIVEREEHCWIKIDGIKGRTYSKPITEEIKAIVEKAIYYTTEKCGNSEFVFADKRDPSKPMPYSTITYHLDKIINELDMRDDQGNPFKLKTHIFRHCYGVKLTELHVPDEIIARLLGHKNTDSVRFYRRMSNKIMAEETRQTREKIDNILLEIVKEWDGYESLFLGKDF